MTRGRPRQFDREKALDTALKLFWTHGYEGTSVALLAKEMGINLPSLYAAFGPKEALFLAAVERYANSAGEIYHRAFTKKTAREVAQAILEGEVNLVTQADKPNGCLMVQGALATSPESEAIACQMATMRATAEQWMAERFQQAKAEGDLPAHADPALLASYIMTLNSGIAVQAKSGVPRTELMKLVAFALQNWPG
jgi:AcrR family transcriptional regulator